MKRLFAALAFLMLATPAWAANFNQPSAGCGGDPKWGLPPCHPPATGAALITLICTGQSYDMTANGKPGFRLTDTYVIDLDKKTVVGGGCIEPCHVLSV